MIEHHDIWPAATGIADLPENWRNYASPELGYIQDLWSQEREALKDTAQLAEFAERLAREWAIETGVIEGLYELDRGVTQTLVEQGFQSTLLERRSTNQPREYVMGLLQDQKDSLEGLFAFVKQQRRLSTSYIKELHAAITRSQAGVESVDPHGKRQNVELLRGDWKRLPNYPLKDGVQLRYCPPEQVEAEMDRLIEMHREHVHIGIPAEIGSTWLHHRFTQIHPFQDGNGRVARAIASLIFIEAGLFPLVVTRDDKILYLDALESADSGNLEPLVRLFRELQVRQFRRATNLSEKIQKPAQSIDEALEGFAQVITSRRRPNGATEDRVLALQAVTLKRLTELADKASPTIRALGPGCDIGVTYSATDGNLYLESARLAGASSFGVLPIAPFAWVCVEFRVPRPIPMVFCAAGVDPNIDGLVQALAYWDDGSRTPPVLSEAPFDWYPQEAESTMLAAVADWIERAFVQALVAVQQSL